MNFAGEFAALLTAMLWSGSSLLFAAATVRVGSLQVNVARLMIAAVILGLAVLVMGPETGLSVRQALLLGSSGVIGLAVGDSFLFRAYQDLGARITMLIMSLAPAFSAVLGYLFLGEKLAGAALGGMAVTLGGIALVVLRWDGRQTAAEVFQSTGILYAMFASVGQAGGLILAKLAFNESPVNGFYAAFVRIVASLVVIVPLLLAAGRWGEPLAAFRRDRRALLLTVGGSILGPVLGISLSLIAVTNTSVAIAATLMATVPIMMLPLVRVVHKEVLSWHAVVGALIAVGGVALLFLR
jgi:drug/metabolite transporter (DMT)-like permease